MDIHILPPKAGVDYPGDWNEFLSWFDSEDACLAYLEKLRWPQGFVCPDCSSVEPAYRSSRGRLVCRACEHQCTVTSGTVFDKTRTPLRVWLAAAWYLTNQKPPPCRAIWPSPTGNARNPPRAGRTRPARH